MAFGPGLLRTDDEHLGEDDGSLSELEHLLRRPGVTGDLAALRETAKRLASRGSLVAGLFCSAALACILVSTLGSSVARRPPAGTVSALDRSALRGGLVSLDAGLPALPRLGRLPRNASAPEEDHDNGTACGHDEELLGKLCYKTCHVLTQGMYPIRTSAMSCCKARPCTPFNSKLSFRVCAGLNVGGNGGRASACPHPPCACAAEEELYLGACYKKCSILTGGKYPNRATSTKCCKANGWACIGLSNSATGEASKVGAAAGAPTAFGAGNRSSAAAETWPPSATLATVV